MNFNTTKDETEIILKIVNRVSKTYRNIDRLGLEMDITACHCNGNPLDLDGLLNAEDFDFFHDISGICENINRNTGKLENCFLPRYSIIEIKSKN